MKIWGTGEKVELCGDGAIGAELSRIQAELLPGAPRGRVSGLCSLLWEVPGGAKFPFNPRITARAPSRPMLRGTFPLSTPFS